MALDHVTLPTAPPPAAASQLPAASLILPGAAKAGTTSLFWALAQHTEICRSSVKETLFFTPASETEAGASGRIGPISDYRRYYRRWSGERYLLEATPRYLAGGRRLVAALDSSLRDAHVAITLRDPVSRSWSLYRFAQARLLIPRSQSFEEYLEIAGCIERRGDLQTDENRPYWNFSTSRYADHLGAWLDVIPPGRLRILFFEQVVADMPATLRGLCRWLGLDDAEVGAWNLDAQNRTAPYRFELLQRAAHAANHERLLRNHPRLKRPLRAAYLAANGVRTRTQMRPLTRRHLARAFGEPNARLRGVLERHGYSDFPDWLAA